MEKIHSHIFSLFIEMEHETRRPAEEHVPKRKPIEKEKQEPIVLRI